MKELVLYEKRLAQALCCPPVLRKQLLTNTREIAQDFLAGKPDATWEDMEEFLGNPQELAQTMLEAEDQEALARYRKRRLLLKRGTVALLVVICITLVGLLTYILHMRATAPPVVATETFIIYETENAK